MILDLRRKITIIAGGRKSLGLAVRQALVDRLLRDVHIREGTFGEHSITVSPSSGGDVVRWSATKATTQAGDLGMNVTTGRPSGFVGGVDAPLALQSEVSSSTGSLRTRVAPTAAFWTGNLSTGAPTASYDAVGGTFCLVPPPLDFNTKGLYKTIPAAGAAPWAIEALIVPGFTSTGVNSRMGVMVSDAGFANSRMLSYEINSSSLVSRTLVSLTNGVSIQTSPFSMASSGIYIRIRSDGVNTFYELSVDGLVWITHTAPQANFAATTAGFGFYADVGTVGLRPSFRCLDLSVGTPQGSLLS